MANLFQIFVSYRLGKINNIFANQVNKRNENEDRRRLKSSFIRKQRNSTPHQSNREKARRVRQMQNGILHVDSETHKVINFN